MVDHNYTKVKKMMATCPFKYYMTGDKDRLAVLRKKVLRLAIENPDLKVKHAAKTFVDNISCRKGMAVRECIFIEDTEDGNCTRSNNTYFHCKSLLVPLREMQIAQSIEKRKNNQK